MTLEEALAPDQPWHVAYPAVVKAARTFLLSAPENCFYSTDHLVQELYSGTDEKIRERIFKGLKATSHVELADCWLSIPGVRFGVEVNLKHWHRPYRSCPECGAFI